jgi:hypothetical protein
MNGRAYAPTIRSVKASSKESMTSISLLNSWNSWPLHLSRGRKRSGENGMRSRRPSEVHPSRESSSTSKPSAIRGHSLRTRPEPSVMSRSRSSTALLVQNLPERGLVWPATLALPATNPLSLKVVVSTVNLANTKPKTGMSFIAIKALLATSVAVESTANSFRSNNLGKFELTNIP